MYGYTKIQEQRVDPTDQTITELKGKSRTFEPGLFLLIGCNYLLNENLILGAVFMPSVQYQYQETEDFWYEDDIFNKDTKRYESSIRYYLSLQNIRLSLAYRFK